MFHDEDGRRTDSNRICTPAQLARADLRLQEICSRPSGAGRPIGKPMLVGDQYMTQLLFPDGCNVNYDRNRRMTGSSGPCTRAHLERADEEIRAVRR